MTKLYKSISCLDTRITGLLIRHVRKCFMGLDTRSLADKISGADITDKADPLFSTRTLERLEKGEHLPSKQVAWKVIVGTNITADHFFGRFIHFSMLQAVYGVPVAYHPTRMDGPDSIITGRVLRFYMQEYEVDVQQLSEILEEPLNTVRKWVSGARTPNFEALWVLADMFGTSLDVLLGLAIYYT